MFLTQVIVRLRNAAPVFEQRVAGTASFVAGSGPNSDIDPPACFVVPMYETAERPKDATTVQWVTERFATVVCLDNSVEKRQGTGLSAQIVLDQVRLELRKALLQWTPADKLNMSGVIFQRGQHLFMNAARLWHSFEWSASYYINSEKDPTDTAYAAIEAAIREGWPEVDAGTIARLFVQKDPAFNQFPEGVGTYQEIQRIFFDQLPPWIRTYPEYAGKDTGITDGAPHYATNPPKSTRLP